MFGYAHVETVVGTHIPSTVAPTPGRHALVASVGLLTGLAWVVLWQTDTLFHSFLHLRPGHATGPPALLAALFITGWTVMTVAMMLPTTLPILNTVNALARGRPDRVRLVQLVTAGYVVTWIAFGAVVYLAALGVHALLAQRPTAGAHLYAAPPLLAVAGLFQFSSLKYRCLDKCRTPLSFVLSYWRGDRHRWRAFQVGVGHGLFCVGCCWALMLLMFAAGTVHLAWMLVLGLIMAVEKNMPWGRRISAPLGVVLLGAAVALLTMP